MRVLAWVSGGAASVIAARMAIKKYGHDAVELVRCETGNEDDDNARFEADIIRWLNHPVKVLKSEDYDSVPEVWVKTGWMAGIKGARCTTEMKVKPRLEYQRPDDLHVFGYAADSNDVSRYNRLKDNFFELKTEAPLIDAGITKASCLSMIERAGIELPRTYALGFPNANCLKSGCVKATSAAYWALYRKHFPENFSRTAKISRDLNVRLTRLDGERRFIDEIPEDHTTMDPIVPACDFLCSLAESEFYTEELEQD